jgi:hypothetical protein
VSLDNLQALLNESRNTASSFTRQLEGEERTAQDVEDFINHTRNITVAVTRQDGRPHASPVIGGCVDGEIHVTVSPGSVLANCLKRRPEVAFTVSDLIHSIIGAGTAENLGSVSNLASLRHRLNEASPFGMFAPEAWDGFIYRLDARSLFAF